jgi:hypothetical protein
VHERLARGARSFAHRVVPSPPRPLAPMTFDGVGIGDVGNPQRRRE